MGQRQVQRHQELPAHHLRHQGEHQRDKALHVGAAAAIKAAVPLGQPERIAVPLLAGDRHDVGMAGQDHAAAIWGADRGEQIGLALEGGAQRAGDAVAFEISRDPVDQLEIRARGGGVEGD